MGASEEQSAIEEIDKVLFEDIAINRRNLKSPSVILEMPGVSQMARG